jgi:exopolysaccharide biosynthesis polyprenyl glycosylphosphotransferase
MKLSEIILGLLRIPTDFLMGMLAFTVAYQIRSKTDLIPGIQLPLDLATFPSLPDYIRFSAAAILFLLLIFAANKMYSLKHSLPTGKEIGRVTVLTTAWLMLIVSWFFIIREFPFSRLAIGYSWILAILFVSFGRLLIRLVENILFSLNIGRRKILIIGNNPISHRLIRLMGKDRRIILAGAVDDRLEKIAGLKTLGKVNELGKIVKKYGIDEIIQTRSDLSEAQATDILEFCRENHLGYSFVPDLLAVHQTNVEVETFRGIPVISLKPTPLDGWGRVGKRIFDLVGSTIGLIVLSPVLLVSAIAIKLDSKGTIFFKYLDDGTRVKRVGQVGHLFNFCKFRTMYPNTHNLRYTDLAEKNTREGSPLVKIKDDPRVTRVGRFLRKTSIDELPQLINVLKGEMSLVGPRPHLPEEVAKYRGHHKFVLAIKPGITGMAQISGRSDLDFEEEIRLDTYYIEHWSIWLDIKILLKTVFVLSRGYRE